MNGTGEYYVLSQVLLFTGLSERTVRNHIASGLLKGEKINGLWHFTKEEVEKFINHPAVKPGILTKNNGMIYDFILDTSKKQEEMCVILDVPDVGRQEITEMFCKEICDGEYKNIKFSFSCLSGINRVILKGDSKYVLKLLNFYNNSKKKVQE